MDRIDCFDGEYRWLSNFWECCITYRGVVFSSLEAAYQAAKSTTQEDFDKFIYLTPGKAKKLGKKIKLRADWESVKLSIMEELLRTKFSNVILRNKLMDTGKAELVEGNYWHDNCWGSCTCVKCGNKGENHLGKLLMKLREEGRLAQR